MLSTLNRSVFKANDIFLMDGLRTFLEGKVSSFVARRLPRFSLYEGSFALYPGGPQQKIENETPRKALSKTFGVCASMLAYNAAYYGLFSYGISPDQLTTGALLLGAWWSSSYWAEWPCVDFACSAVARNEPKVLLNKIPYRSFPEINDARKNNKACFYLCAALLLSTYAFIYMSRVSTTEILWERHAPEEFPQFREFAKNVLEAGEGDLWNF